MVRITELLVRKRSEHNNCEISTLEELSLHQEDIEKIENIDKWCRQLKILYLQGNVIPKIENVNRLKKVEYINLALNCIEKVENLSGCESLKKLDLTVNFIGNLSSIKCLQANCDLEELYFTGNPCDQYEGYRDFVVASLPQIKTLDGKQIERSERLLAVQNLESVQRKIIEQEEVYALKRAQQRENRLQKPTPKDDDDFWKQEEEFTPEVRKEMQDQIRKQKDAKEGKKDSPKQKRQRPLFSDEGRPYNINEPKIGFSLTENADIQSLVLDVEIFKHMDTSLLDVDVQPNYVKVVIKDQILQIALTSEIMPDRSVAQRSQITGHLVVTMPVLGQLVQPVRNVKRKPETLPDKILEQRDSVKAVQNVERLEVGEVSFNKKNVEPSETDFVDDSDVPPLM